MMSLRKLVHLLSMLLLSGVNCHPSRDPPFDLAGPDVQGAADLFPTADLARACDGGQRSLLAEAGKVRPYYQAHDVSMDGATLALGYYAEAVVYLLVRQGQDWVVVQKLNGPSGSAFGYSVVVKGDTLFVGARGNFASIYKRNLSGTWAEAQKIVPNDLSQVNDFGVALAADENTLAITDHSGGQVRGGAVYVYTNLAEQWLLQQKLSALDGRSGDSVGNAVALSRDTLLVGAQIPAGPSDNPGAAYVFLRTAGTWAQQQKLRAPDGMTGVVDAFGGSVGLADDVALVGAYWANPNKSGALYVFTRTGVSWTYQKKLTAPGQPADAHFSYPLSARGNYALVGGMRVPRANGGVGSVSLFSMKSLEVIQTLEPSDSSAGFGQARGVNMDVDQAVILGAANPPVAAYVYSFGSPSCPSPPLNWRTGRGGDE